MIKRIDVYCFVIFLGMVALFSTVLQAFEELSKDISAFIGGGLLYFVIRDSVKPRLQRYFDKKSGNSPIRTN